MTDQQAGTADPGTADPGTGRPVQDVDANGILNVTARDKDTGAEQRVTISETSNLDRSEVERMVRDAEQHRSEDQRLREMIDARNELDTATYQLERRLTDLGDGVPTHEKARAEDLIESSRQAVREEAPLDRVRSLTAEVQQATQAVNARAAAPPPGDSQGSSGPTGAQGSADDDDVIDAEFDRA